MDIAYGTKVYDYERKSIGILICTYNLGYVDAPDATGAKVVDTRGKSYPTNLDNLRPIDDINKHDLRRLNIPEWFSN